MKWKVSVSLLLLTLTAACSAKTSITSITRQNFEKSPMCIKFKCKLVSAYPKDGIYRYSIIDSHKQAIRIFISNSQATKNDFSIYGAPGSLQSIPSIEVVNFFIMTTEYYTGVKLDIRNDIYGAGSLVGPNQIEFFDLKSGKIGNVPVKIYEKSLPDDSMDPEKASLVYGIIDTVSYPPEK